MQLEGLMVDNWLMQTVLVNKYFFISDLLVLGCCKHSHHSIYCRYWMNEYLNSLTNVASWISIVQYQITMQQGSTVITNNTLALRPANSIAALLIHTLTHQQALQLQHDSLSEVWKKKSWSLSPVERVYFSSSATGNTGAVGYGICRTLVLVAPLDLCSQRQFPQVVDHCLDHFSLKYVLVT